MSGLKFDYYSWSKAGATGNYCKCRTILISELSIKANKEVHDKCGKPILRRRDFECSQEQFEKNGACN